jgi:hypothetical protein
MDSLLFGLVVIALVGIAKKIIEAEKKIIQASKDIEND